MYICLKIPVGSCRIHKVTLLMLCDFKILPANLFYDLVDALAQKIIAGAGLDVFEQEPLGGSPLLELENVVITPHTAGSTIDTWWRRLDFAFENIGRVSRGEKPLFVVDQ